MYACKAIVHAVHVHQFLPLIWGAVSFGISLFLDPLAEVGRSNLVSLPRPSSSTLSAFWATDWPFSRGSPCLLPCDEASLSGGGRLCDGCKLVCAGCLLDMFNVHFVQPHAVVSPDKIEGMLVGVVRRGLQKHQSYKLHPIPHIKALSVLKACKADMPCVCWREHRAYSISKLVLTLHVGAWDLSWSLTTM